MMAKSLWFSILMITFLKMNLLDKMGDDWLFLNISRNLLENDINLTWILNNSIIISKLKLGSRMFQNSKRKYSKISLKVILLLFLRKDKNWSN